MGSGELIIRWSWVRILAGPPTKLFEAPAVRKIGATAWQGLIGRLKLFSQMFATASGNVKANLACIHASISRSVARDLASGNFECGIPVRPALC
jgi:hypothetical protein